MCIHRYLESMEMIIRIPYKANVLMLGSGRMIVGMKIEEGQLITSVSSDNERVGGEEHKISRLFLDGMSMCIIE